MSLSVFIQGRFAYSRLSHFRARPPMRATPERRDLLAVPQILAASHMVRRVPCLKSTAGTIFFDFFGAGCVSAPEFQQVRRYVYNSGLHGWHGNFGPSRHSHAAEPPEAARSRSFLRIIDGWDQNFAIFRCHFSTVPRNTAGQGRAYIRPVAISHPRNGPGRRFHASPRTRAHPPKHSIAIPYHGTPPASSELSIFSQSWLPES
jgi:hypothetical protein